jgi:hypothetical protein
MTLKCVVGARSGRQWAHARRFHGNGRSRCGPANLQTRMHSVESQELPALFSCLIGKRAKVNALSTGCMAGAQVGIARVAKLVDAHDSGSCVERHGGSSPLASTTLQLGGVGFGKLLSTPTPPIFLFPHLTALCKIPSTSKKPSHRSPSAML